MARTKLKIAVAFIDRFFKDEECSVESKDFERHWKTVRARIKEARPTVRAKRPVQQPNQKICIWHHDEEGWLTDCGEYFVLNNGRPYQNGMRFCYHCGGKLHAVR